MACNEGSAAECVVDIHLAWRAEGCPCAGGEVLWGTAPWVQLRAMEEMLRGARIRSDVARLVASYGEVLALDAVVAAPGGMVGVVGIDGACRDGFRAAMVTVALQGVDGERYIELLSAQSQAGHGDRQIGFLFVLGARDEGEALLQKVGQARTIRASELPLLLHERPGREAARV